MPSYFANCMMQLEKRRGKLHKVPLLLHDNAPAYKSHVGRAALHECGFEEMHHLPYSPDLAPSDYHLFPNLKNYLHGSTDSELKHATDEWLKGVGIVLFFYFTGLKKLHDRYGLCNDKGGDYVKK